MSAETLYTVTFPDGARISESPRFPIEVACLKVGTIVTVVEIKGDKCRITKPVRGWCSTAHIKVKESSSKGKPTSNMPKIEVDDRCVLIDGRVGTVKYVGTTEFAKGNWYGVALDKQEGKHNGMVKGKRYFDCDDQHGVFVRMNKIAKVKSGKSKGGTRSGNQIGCVLPDGKKVYITYNASQRIGELKQNFLSKGKLHKPDQYQLAKGGSVPNESNTLQAEGISPGVTFQMRKIGSSTSGSGSGKEGRDRWYGCWFFEGEESYVDLSLNVGAKRLNGEAVDEDSDSLVINGTVKKDDQGHPKWTFKMTMKGEPTIINVGVLINGRIKGVWKVLDSWGKFEMCPAKQLNKDKDKTAKSGSVI